MTYTNDVDMPMFARFDAGKLTAIMVLDPAPGSTNKIDITLSLIELLQERYAGQVPFTTQTL